ncbi:putative oxidoreductase [Viridothelium virens]|uniref:Putative oxidoreductase n=1 Tax=Viridothelium virens TaxID=1048519 RepID=A0A6A6HLD1_VIRVR|nr:putative oxidoreductase [Viridothelium virens]
MTVSNGLPLDIPVIDLSDESKVGKDVVEVVSRLGFLFVKNAGEDEILQEHINHLFKLSQAFFSSPVAVKETCSINSNKSGKNKGWLSMGEETLDPGNQKRGDVKEAFNIGEFIDGKAQQPLPEVLAAHHDEIARFQASCHALCNRILRTLARGLEITEGDWFAQRHDQSKGPSGSVLRLLYYPTVSGDTDSLTEDIRAGAHSDYGSVTLLFQLPGQPGLEILTPQGTWSPVPVNPNNDPTPPVLVNIGDLLSYWTNGLLKSTVHRVIFPNTGKKGGDDRYSIVYFCHPQDDEKLLPVPSPLVEQHGAGKAQVTAENVMTARDHLNNRLAATYKLS